MFRVLGSKDPDDVTPYQFDWTAIFTDQEDTCDSATVEVVNDAGAPIASDLDVVWTEATGKGVVTAWLSGGTAGVRYLLRCTVRGARTIPVQASDCKTVVIPVRQR